MALPAGLMGGVAGGIGVNIVIKAVDNYSRNLNKAGSLAKKLGGILKGVGIAAAAASVAVGAFAVREAAQFERTQIAFKVMLGSADKAQAKLKELADFSKRTPFKLGELEENSRLLLGMGIEANALIPTMKSLGDVSAGLGVDFTRLALNFGQVKAQGRLLGTELRDFARAGVPIIAELAKNLGVAEAEIKKLASEGKISFANVEEAFRTMSSEGGVFANMMEQTMDTASGQLSMLQDASQKAGRALGEEMLAPMTEGMRGLTETIEENMDTWRLLGSVAGTVLSGLLKGISNFVEGIDAIGFELRILIDSFKASPFSGEGREDFANKSRIKRALMESDLDLSDDQVINFMGRSAAMGLSPDQAVAFARVQSAEERNQQIDETIKKNQEMNDLLDQVKATRMTEDQVLLKNISTVEDLVKRHKELDSATGLSTIETFENLNAMAALKDEINLLEQPFQDLFHSLTKTAEAGDAAADKLWGVAGKKLGYTGRGPSGRGHGQVQHSDEQLERQRELGYGPDADRFNIYDNAGGKVVNIITHYNTQNNSAQTAKVTQ